MAVIYADANGQVQGLRHTAAEEQAHPLPASPAPAYVVRFDGATNAGLLAQYDLNAQAFTMPGGTVTVAGTPATINPPGLLYTALAEAPAILAKIRSTTDPLTRDEVAAIGVAAFHALGVDG